VTRHEPFTIDAVPTPHRIRESTSDLHASEIPSLVRLLLAHPSTADLPAERAPTLPSSVGRRIAEIVFDETGHATRYVDGIVEPTDAASRARAIAARVRRGGIADLKADEVETFASMCRLRGLPLGVDR
jgi:hypothetical protein